MHNLSVIIPVYNEEKTIHTILKKVSELKYKDIDLEVIVIDDGSTDGTLNILKSNTNLYEKLIENGSNRGKGYSVKEGIKNSNGNYIIFQDADLEYDPEDFLKFFKIINRFNPDLIIGSRLNYSDYTRSHNILNKFGNKLITLVFNLVYNTTFTDIYSCYACYKKNLFNAESLKSEGFDQQAEILSKVVKNGKLFYEIPINYNGRTHEEGKKIKFYHIFSVFYQILKNRVIS